jgi:hypothetical protein
MQTFLKRHHALMKKELFSLVFLFFVLPAMAQDQDRYDSIIRKAVARYIGHPDCDVCDSAGLALLKIFKKNDSIQVQVLYASEPMYNIESYKNLSPWLNKRYGKLFKNKYKVLVPVYFRYDTEKQHAPLVSSTQKAILTKQAKKRGRKIHLAQPVTILGYEPRR